MTRGMGYDAAKGVAVKSEGWVEPRQGGTPIGFDTMRRSTVSPGRSTLAVKLAPGSRPHQLTQRSMNDAPAPDFSVTVAIDRLGS